MPLRRDASPVLPYIFICSNIQSILHRLRPRLPPPRPRLGACLCSRACLFRCMWGLLRSSGSSSGRAEALAVYRALLRGARTFPSIKRDKVYEEIRVEYRRCQSITDEQEVAKLREVRAKQESQRKGVTKLVSGLALPASGHAQRPLGHVEARRRHSHAQADASRHGVGGQAGLCHRHCGARPHTRTSQAAA